MFLRHTLIRVTLSKLGKLYFLPSTLRDFGFGRLAMEEILSEEVSELLRDFESLGGRPIDAMSDLTISVVSSLWRIVAGERLSRKDPR